MLTLLRGRNHPTIRNRSRYRARGWEGGAVRGGSRKSAHFPAAIWRTISPVSGKALPAAITTTARAEKGRIYRIADAHIRTLALSLSLLLFLSCRPYFFSLCLFLFFSCLFIRPILLIASNEKRKGAAVRVINLILQYLISHHRAKRQLL